MTIAKLKEAAKAADELSQGASFKIVMAVQREGVVVRAFKDTYSHNYMISWDQLTESHINPLLPAIRVVTEPFMPETPNAEG